MSDDEVLEDATAPNTRRPTSVDWQRLGVEDAELLIKLLSYLTRKLNQIAAIQFTIGPVESEKRYQKYKDGFTLIYIN